VVRGCIVPHAPALLLVRGYPEVIECGQRIRSAISTAVEAECELLIVVSPHSRSSGVYTAGAGSLDGFGMIGFDAAVPVAKEVAAELAVRWERPTLEGALDHGVVVPWLLARIGVPVVAVGIREITGPGAGRIEEAVHDAQTLAGALERTASGHRALVMISAHTSAALSARAPLLDRPDGHRLDESVRAALESDVGHLAFISRELWLSSGSCGAGPLAVAGHLWGGRRARILAYGHPAGVGYLVAEVPADEQA
jgi:hypothetical protein